MPPALDIRAAATSPTPAIRRRPAKHGPQIAHQSATLRAYCRSLGTATHIRNAIDPTTKKRKTIAARSRGSIFLS